jgi:hypothetical protein
VFLLLFVRRLVARLESGPALSLCRSFSLELLARQSFSQQTVNHAFAFSDSLLVVCFPGRLNCHSRLLGDEVSIALSVDQKSRPDIVISHAAVTRKLPLFCRRPRLWMSSIRPVNFAGPAVCIIPPRGEALASLPGKGRRKPSSITGGESGGRK